MEALEQAQSRLENIRSVQPILTALRTISLGRWQKAKWQIATAQAYQQELCTIMAWLQPHLPQHNFMKPDHIRGERRVVVLIGSEQGLCGHYNDRLISWVKRYITKHSHDAPPLKIGAIGQRLIRQLGRENFALGWHKSLPKSATECGRLAYDLTTRWITAYQANEFDRVDLIFNRYRSIGLYGTKVLQLLPPQLPEIGQCSTADTWPPPIIETDPTRLYNRVVTEWLNATVYQALQESTAAEQSARYQLMEAATKNADRLVEALGIVVQTAHQRAITQETQALSIGAGLLSPKQ